MNPIRWLKSSLKSYSIVVLTFKTGTSATKAGAYMADQDYGIISI